MVENPLQVVQYIAQAREELSEAREAVEGPEALVREFITIDRRLEVLEALMMGGVRCRVRRLMRITAEQSEQSVQGDLF